VAAGWVHGLGPAPRVSSNVPPLQALAERLLPALQAGACYISFSGGRDSSAVLALATRVAREHGLEDPVPVTQLFPDLPAADESEWQQLVVEHLGLRNWLRFSAPGNEDLLGAGTAESLARRGLVWPATVHTKVSLLEQLSPGTLLTGEGGDEVLGPRRAAPWPHLRKGTPVRRSKAALAAAGSLAPRPLRHYRAWQRYKSADLRPWLRPGFAEECLRLAARDDAAEPLNWAGSLMWVCRRRSCAVSARNFGALAAEYGVRVINPLLDPRFLASLGHSGGRWGFPGRTAAMKYLFADVLPAAVIERPTKAVFTRAFLGEETARFARDWDGSGVDPELVDADRLRQEWLSESPSALSGPLLHAAWLHRYGLRG